ncbi:acetolactate synthase small subunit [Pueribacillus sp. YX66]|uniref:acetolactate synthase small subunit n=1 Tax=Pueribacillus sp. YX66 TaxID=3229242 RepID=UPI00358D7A03
MKRIITLTVNNRAGVMNRITGLFMKRQYNIESITVGHAETPDVSRMTFVVNVECETKLEQVIKQLHKQIDVLKVHDVTEQRVVVRELALIKVLTSTPQTRSELFSLIEPFRASVVDVSTSSLTIEVTGNPDKIDALLELVRPFGIKELSRTGVTALTRGTQKNEAEIKPFSIIN